MKKLIYMFIIFLSGCSAVTGIVDSSAKVNDNALLAAKFTICRGASIGSVVREFNTEEKAKAWKELCTQDNEAVSTIFKEN